METEQTPLPSSDGDEIWDKIEAQEDENTVVEISAQELQELEEFLSGVRQIILSHERRLTSIEKFLLAAMQGASDEVDSDESEGTGEGSPDGDSEQATADGGGNASDSGGTEVPSNDS